MTKPTAHANCDHEATKAARAACRREAAQAAAKITAAALELIEVFDGGPSLTGIDWVTRGAVTFTDFKEGDRTEAARALLAYFAPSGDEDTDRRRRANGYTITTSAHEIRRIILRRFS